MLKRYLIATVATIGLLTVMVGWMSVFFGGFYLAVRTNHLEIGWSIVGLFFFLNFCLMVYLIEIGMSQAKNQ